MGRVRSHKSRELDDHIVEKGHGVEFGAENAPVENVGWETVSAEIHADPLAEGGTGQKLIARRFFFQLPPTKEEPVTMQEILDYHKKHTIIPMLWKDELELAQDPRIIEGKKGKFTIVALCVPSTRFGVKSVIHERPELIQNIIQNGSDTR